MSNIVDCKICHSAVSSLVMFVIGHMRPTLLLGLGLGLHVTTWQDFSGWGWRSQITEEHPEYVELAS